MAMGKNERDTPASSGRPAPKGDWTNTLLASAHMFLFVAAVLLCVAGFLFLVVIVVLLYTDGAMAALQAIGKLWWLLILCFVAVAYFWKKRGL